MVIRDDRVHSGFRELRHLVDRSNPAVHCEDEIWLPRQDVRQDLSRQPIAVDETLRKERFHVRTQRPQSPEGERSAGDAVHVEVAEDHDLAVVLERLVEELEGPVGPQKIAGRGQVVQVRAEKAADLVRLGLAAGDEDSSHDRGAIEGAHEASDLVLVLGDLLRPDPVLVKQGVRLPLGKVIGGGP